MFTSQNIPALFKKGTLKLQATDDGDLRRVAEATLVIEPFSVALGRELGEEIASHLFTDDGTIRDELEAIDLRVRAGLQHVTVRPDEALEPIALLSPVSLKDVSATLVEDKKTQRCWLAFSFVLVFSLEEKAARNFVLDQFGRTLFWSFESLQRSLLADARVLEAAARLGESCGSDGSVTITAADPNGVTSGPVTLNPEKAVTLRSAAREIRNAAGKSRTH